MCGDATRTPLILDVTKELFQKEETQRTLNSIDAIARGAALQSAFLSPSFSTAAFSVQEFNHLPIEVVYGDNGSEETKKAVMFNTGLSKVPNKKSITFNNKVGGMHVQLKYAEGAEVLTGLPGVIAQYQVPEGKLKQEGKDKHTHEVCFDIQNTMHHIPVLKEVNLVENWQEEEKIAIKKPAPAPPKKEDPNKLDDGKPEPPAPTEAETVQEYETKIRKKQTST